MLVLADHRQATGRGTRDMRQTLEQLISNGVEVRGQSGHEIRAEYLAAGRSVPAARGAMHAKSLLVDQYLIIGSTNWTTASRSNADMSVKLRAKGKDARYWLHAFYAVVRMSQWELTTGLKAAAQNAATQATANTSNRG